MEPQTRPARDYGTLADFLSRPVATRDAAMRLFTDAAWQVLAPTGVSWIGFYTAEEGDREMVLAVCRDKPACSPIGLHGACGRSWREGRTLIVTDVKHLGPDYIACDPRDRSELVIPCFEADGRCWGVLDVDSFDAGAFDERDAEAMTDLLRSLGLSSPAAPEPEPPIIV